MTSLTTQWITRAEDFHSLKNEWNELLLSSSCNTLFLTWEWQYTWWMNLAEGRTLLLLTVRDGEKLIGLAPLSLRPADYPRMVPFRVLELIGTGSVGSDYLSIIVRGGDEKRALAEMCRHLVSRKFVLEMSNTERSSSIMIAAALQMQELGCRTARHTQNFSPYIDLSNCTWGSYIARKGSSSQSRYKKKIKRMHRDFSVSMNRTTTEEQRSSDLGTMIELHLKRWSGRGGSNAFGTAALCKFHDTFSRIALQNDWLRLYILRLNGQPAAAVYGFSYLGVFYYYQAGFDPQFSQYSVGLLSVGLTLELAIAEGATEYDMLRGEEEYKYIWANDERELVCLRIYPPNLQGYLCSQMMGLRSGVKTLFLSRAPTDQRDRLHTAG